MPWCSNVELKKKVDNSYSPMTALILKGYYHEIGKACRWFHWTDMKFKGFHFMFIFNLKVVFTTNFLRAAPNPCAL
jgi:hypothetical protein